MNKPAQIEPESPFVFGEVLYDLFDDGQEVLGGAPFNVAWHLCGLGLTPLMISRVGRDRRGESVLETMARWSMETCGIQIDPDRPTGLVRAVVTDGQPTFQIDPEQAYDFITYDPAIFPTTCPGAATAADTENERHRNILCHGTLALRHDVSRQALSRLLADRNPTVLIDVNLRSPWWTPSEVASCLDRARWAKLNEAEVGAVADVATVVETGAVEGVEPAGNDIAAVTGRLLERHELAGAIVTRGQHGALWMDRGGASHAAGAQPVTNLVDTVGAGDAFTAVALVGLLRGWSPPLLLRRAVSFAAAICQRQGATAFEPELYERTLTKWEHDGDAI